MKELTTSGASLEPGTGVGDGANFWDDRLYAQLRDHRVDGSGTGAAVAKVGADAVGLAKAVIARLKGSGDQLGTTRRSVGSGKRLA